MTRFSLRAIVLALSLAALLAAPAVSDAQSRVAVPRSRPGGSTVIVGARYYNPYYFYRPYYYGGYYSPWYYPFSFSLGFGYGYPCCGYPYYGGYPYYYGGYYGASALRVQVPQREAEVFIDGYYAGRVDNFDGTFQRLHLEPGEHDLELFLPGHRSFQQKIYTQPGSTFRVRHEMQPLGAGEAEPTRPVAPPRTTRAEPSSRSSRPTTRVPQRPPATTEPAPDDPRPGNAESDFGSIALRVQPGDAIVMINGERWDGAQDQERIVVQLGAGTHNVEIRRDGYRTYITDITVRPGETTTLNVSLTRQ